MRDGPRARDTGVYSYTGQIAEVAVDKGTGKVNLLQLAISCDVGKAIHLQSLKGQIKGGCLLVRGYALSEKIILEKCGYYEIR